MFKTMMTGAIFALSIGAALAQPMPPAPPPPPEAPLAACQGDAMRYCQGIRPGQGRIRACMRSNQDRLSPACKDAISSVIQRRQQMREQRQQRRQQYRQQYGLPPRPPGAPMPPPPPPAPPRTMAPIPN